MDDFNALMNSITNVYLAGMGLPPLPHDPSNDPVQRGSSLWNRLAIQTDDCGDASGYCSECGYETERYDEADGDWVCVDCNAALVREQEEDRRLDSPTHGQAADINKYRYEP